MAARASLFLSLLVAAISAACEPRDAGGDQPSTEARDAAFADGAHAGTGNGSAGTYGYVFVDSKLTSDSGITGDVLARIDVGAYPASNVAFINCTMGSHITPVGWLITAGTNTSALRFWEYQSKTEAGSLINTGQRLGASRQLLDAEAAMMRNPGAVLGGWQPPK